MKKVLSLLLVVVMIFGLAACGGGGGSDEPAKVDKVTVGLTSWPTSLDPAALMGKQNTPWLAQVYDTLLDRLLCPRPFRPHRRGGPDLYPHRSQ